MLQLILFFSALKTLCIIFYHSTDFEVHRNWLAITNSLPISKWYIEDRSEWTLDYPPFFAWFEYCLSHIAKLFDRKMVDVNSLNYASQNTIFFQRLSVVLTDLVYIYAVTKLAKLFTKNLSMAFGVTQKMVLIILLVGNFGLFIVDHIHFQYNGILYGILLLSIHNLLVGNMYWGAFQFSILLNFKHIYLYMAPAFFVYILKFFCFSNQTMEKRVTKNSTRSCRLSIPGFGKLDISRLVLLSVIVISVFGVSFGPFIAMGQMGQVLARLFPFKRGLCHAYWAPNFWVFYNIADKFFEITLKKLGFGSHFSGKASMTGGLVQEYNHVVLPSIKPIHTFLLTIVFMLPVLLKLWRAKDNPPRRFLEAVILCSWVSFIFGWHVHEKAILMVLLPLSLLVFCDVRYARLFSVFSTCVHYSLTPLVFTSSEQAFIFALFLLFESFKFFFVGQVYGRAKNGEKLLQYSKLQMFYLSGFAFIHIYCVFLHGFLSLSERLPFLPLMLVSCYCALGNISCFLQFYVYYLLGASG